MISFGDLKRIKESISRKIFLLIGRSIVTYIDNANDTQKVQLAILAKETISDVERVQPYGLETYPWTMIQSPTGEFRGSDPDNNSESEAVVLFQAGNRSNGIVIVVGDRYYRLKDLVQGEVALYTYEDTKSGGHRIHLKSGQIIDINGTNVNITCTEDTTITCDGDVTIDAGGDVNVTSGGDTNITSTGSTNIDATTSVNVSSSGIVTVTAAAGIDLDGGGGAPLGVVTGGCICQFSGLPHSDISATVRASK